MTTDLDTVRAALAAASPGPWSRHTEPGTRNHAVLVPGGNDLATCNEGVWYDEPDADLIAHAPEWLAALADEVEALREKLARVEALADDYQHLPPGDFHGADAARELRHALTD